MAILTAFEERRLGWSLFTLALVVYLSTAGGGLTTTDAVTTYDLTRSIVERHSVALSGNLLGKEAERGSDGRYYSPFGIGQSIYNIPFYLAGRTVARHSPWHLGKSDTLAKAFVALGQTLVAAFAVQQTFRLALVVTGDAAAALTAALTLAFGSVLWPYAKCGFNQPLACATFAAAANAAFRADLARRRLLLSGAWLSASLLTRHEMAIAAVPLTIWLAVRNGRSRLQRMADVSVFCGTVTIGVAAWMAYNQTRFGNPMDTGLLRDPTPGFGSPFRGGLAGLLVSPAASVFLFSPFAILGLVGLVRLAVDASRRGKAALLLSWFVLFVLFYASLRNWIGGRAYGSRYLLVVLPCLAAGWAALLARLPRRTRRVVGVAVLLIGITVQLPGVLIDYAKVSQAAGQSPADRSTDVRRWDWRASPLVLNVEALIDRVPANIAYVTGRKARPAIQSPRAADDHGFSQQFVFSLDLWWLYLFYLGVLSRAALAGLVGAIVGAIVIAIAYVPSPQAGRRTSGVFVRDR